MGKFHSKSTIKTKQKVDIFQENHYISLSYYDQSLVIDQVSYLTVIGFIRNNSNVNNPETLYFLIYGILLFYYNDKQTQKTNTALFYHPDCLKHCTTYHVEKPERCSVSFSMLHKYGILKNIKIIKPREASTKELLSTHKQEHIKSIRNTANKSDGWFTSDTFYNKYSNRAANLAVGATIDLMKGILLDTYCSGFALIRPPGHHCEYDEVMGFCLFNNVVIGTNVILNMNLCQKVLIVDWDVHHGNGTQNMFYNNNNVLYFSVHRSDNGKFYPMTGKIEETGNGYNINVPLNVKGGVGYGNNEYLLIWKEILIPVCSEFNPDIIVISAGFDACIGDPLGGMNITPPCYGLLTRLLLNECGNVAVILEGGYNLKTMPRAICCVNYALLKGAYEQNDNYDVGEFEKEFLEYVEVNQLKDDKRKPFNQWKKEYHDEMKKLEQRLKIQNPSNEDMCKEQIKSIKLHHAKYWKFAQKSFDQNDVDDQ